MTNVTIDIGNTIISFGMFKKNKLLKHVRISKNQLDLKVLNNIKKNFFKDPKVRSLISSVVPTIEEVSKSFFKNNTINFISLKTVILKI